MKTAFKIFGALGLVALLGCAALVAPKHANNAAANAADLTAATAVDSGRQVSAGADQQNLTIYPGFALVQEVRTLNLAAGDNRIQLDGVAAQYRTQSLFLTGGDLALRSVSYEQANLTGARLLEKSVGQQVTISYRTAGGAPQQVTGKLLSVSGNELILLPADQRPLVLNTHEGVTVPVLPSGLSRTSSLTLDGVSAQGGNVALRFVYQTGGLSWSANHSLVYDENKGLITRFESSVSVNNGSGTAYNKVGLKLLAGEVRAPRSLSAMRMSESADAAPGAAAPASVESVGEQKLYTVPSRVNLSEGENKQIPLFTAHNVPVEREYFLPPSWQSRSANGKQSVNVRLRLVNDSDSKLGNPLPAGGVTIYQKDSEGNEQITGTANIGHIAKAEKFELLIGATTDIKFERKLTKVTEAPRPKQSLPDDEPRFREETWEVTIYNYKADRDVEVKVSEDVNERAEIVNPSIGFTRENVNRIAAKVNVAKSGKTTVTYTLKTQVN